MDFSKRGDYEDPEKVETLKELKKRFGDEDHARSYAIRASMKRVDLRNMAARKFTLKMKEPVTM